MVKHVTDYPFRREKEVNLMKRPNAHRPLRTQASHKSRAPARSRGSHPTAKKQDGITSVRKAATYVMLCGNCGSTSINTLNQINTCADCNSTQIMSVLQSELESRQNVILERKVEERFHQYMEHKHESLSRIKFIKVLLSIVALVVIVFVLLSLFGSI
jgi:hypothetical protein